MKPYIIHLCKHHYHVTILDHRSHSIFESSIVSHYIFSHQLSCKHPILTIDSNYSRSHDHMVPVLEHLVAVMVYLRRNNFGELDVIVLAEGLVHIDIGL